MKCILLLALAINSVFVSGQEKKEKIYLIKVDKLYDSEKNIFLGKQEILVRGKNIEQVGVNLKKPEGATVINLANCTVTPGLIDAHTHVLTIQKMDAAFEMDLLEHSDIERTLRAIGICRSFLNAGFTTIRDLGNSGMFLDLNLQRAIDKGWVEGPRMIISGPILSPEDGQYFNLASHNRYAIEKEYRVIKNVEDARQAVKDHISKGADVIKVVMGDGRLTLALEEVKKIVETAHAFGIKVTAHATYNEVIDRALEAGVDGIEHGYNIADSLLDKMARKKIYLVPTISSHDAYIQLFKDNNKEQTPELMKNLKSFIVSSEAIVKKAIAKGVMVVNGSDMYLFTGQGQGNTAKASIEAYYNAYPKANDILQTATKNAAIACGVQNITGTIKEKMRADIVAFEGDMENHFIQSLRQVKFVMKDGEIYKQ
ncbi:MAG: amidohydrolase family protein [Agriterribacter sp.]